MLSTPGFASAFTPSSYAQNEWMASSEVTWSPIACSPARRAGRLDAAVGRVAVRELPLLPDHLHVAGLECPARKERGVGPWPPPAPSLSSSYVPKPARKSTVAVVITTQSELDAGVAADRRARRRASCSAARNDDEARRRRRRTSRQTIGVTIAEHHLVVEDLLVPARVALPGGMCGPTKITTSGVAIALRTSQTTTTRCRSRGRMAAPVPRSGRPPSGRHVEEAVHVADRLHRPAEAVERSRRRRGRSTASGSGRASGAERERDRRGAPSRSHGA